MTILLVLLGIIFGLLVYVISHYILKKMDYVIVKKELEDMVNVLHVLIIVIDIFTMCKVLLCLIAQKISILFIIGVIIGITFSILYICYHLFSSQGKCIRMIHKIKNIQEQIYFLKSYGITEKQKQAVKLLDETQKKLKEQVCDMLIMDSIKVAKNIELSNDGVNIQRELDELEALQILNKG